MNIPIYMKVTGGYIPLEEKEIIKGKELPNPFGILISESGTFFFSNTKSHSSIVPIGDKIKGLSKVKPETTHSYPPISFEIFNKALSFFRGIYKEHKSEACILLTLDKSQPLIDQEYGVFVPEQKVSGASVDYKVEELPENTILAGSIHSHPDFGASQSSTDHNDEYNFDGIHVTLGQVTDDVPEVHQRMCINGQVLPCTSMIKTSPLIEEVEVEESWTKKVTKTKIQYLGVYNGYHGQRHGGGQHYLAFNGALTLKQIKDCFMLMKGVPINQKNSKSLTSIFI